MISCGIGRGIALALLAGFVLPATATALSGRDVVVQMKEARERGSDQKSVFRMVLVTKRGDTVSRTLVSYRKKFGADSKSLMFFREPADVARTGVLVWSYSGRDDDQWLYLPDLGRVRQINAGSRGESFMGSDFSYADLSDIDVDERAHDLVGEEEMDGQPTYKVESVPKKSDVYSKVVTWVSRETFLPVRIDYYDPAGVLLKTGQFRDVRVVKSIPTPFALNMQNVQTGHRTELSILEIDYNLGLDDQLFTERYLKRGP